MLEQLALALNPQVRVWDWTLLPEPASQRGCGHPSREANSGLQAASLSVAWGLLLPPRASRFGSLNWAALFNQGCSHEELGPSLCFCLDHPRRDSAPSNVAAS